MEFIPISVKAFVVALGKNLPNVQPQVESGGEKAGNWWIDLPAATPITVEWRPSKGFGLFVETSGYGEGPDEIFSDPERAARRIAQLMAPASKAEPTRLRAIRELYGFTQERIAKKLKKRQAAVSRLEKRGDIKIGTLNQFVRALGGRMEIHAVFPDGRLPIYTADKKANAHGASKSHRLSRLRKIRSDRLRP